MFLELAGGDIAKVEQVKGLLWMDFYMHLQLLRERQEEEKERQEKARDRSQRRRQGRRTN